MLSIVIPVYNMEKLLPRCLDSVLAQDCKDWELIIVDDGSTDGSGDICDRYGHADARVRVIHQANAGVSVARNVGIEAARGERVIFIDSDDQIDPDYIGAIIRAVEGSDCDIAIAGWRDALGVHGFGEQDIPRDAFFEFFMKRIMRWSFAFGKTYRRQFLLDNGLRFPVGIVWAEDTIFLARCLMVAKSAKTVDTVGYNYIYRPGSASNRIHPIDKEMAGLEMMNALMPQIVKCWGIEAKRYIGPFPYLFRVVRSFYYNHLERDERLRRMKALEFDRRMMYYSDSHWKTRFISWLIVNRHWRVADYMLSRSLKV